MPISLPFSFPAREGPSQAGHLGRPAQSDPVPMSVLAARHAARESRFRPWLKNSGKFASNFLALLMANPFI